MKWFRDEVDRIGETEEMRTQRLNEAKFARVQDLLTLLGKASSTMPKTPVPVKKAWDIIIAPLDENKKQKTTKATKATKKTKPKKTPKKSKKKSKKKTTKKKSKKKTTKKKSKKKTTRKKRKADTNLSEATRPEKLAKHTA
jgi:outer membrane biosynthesis protein TonB